MSTKKTLRAALTIAAALVMLSACETVSSDDLTELENEVADLRTRLDAADARSAEAEAAAARCTEVCEATSERTDRMLQQSLQK